MIRPLAGRFLLPVLLSVLVACSAGNRQPGTKEIDDAQAVRMLDSDRPPLILDVRNPEEYSEEHIPGARLVPLNTLSDSLGVLSPYRKDEIIAVCRSGRRSGIAAEQLLKAGFTKVHNLKGGMIKWKQNGGKVE